ncbi:MAG TPA: hypothetical protein DIU15_10050 [Deltaproteobacteria bacterium]|nr:hypothetical protein [Deltaproteobacteria bacterium]HCP46375.1 hypothetical protein [Deltaproteobacteria bacterium]
MPRGGGQRRSRGRPRLACADEQLERALAGSGSLDAGAVRRLRLWSEELERWSKTQRLVGWSSVDGLLHEGVADAWAMAPLLSAQEGRPLVDLGSGAGLPGLILAAAYPALPIHLIESRRKRASFLRQAARVMELERVHVHHGRSEQFCKTLCQGESPTVTARAFAAPSQVIASAEAWGAGACILSIVGDALPQPLPEGWVRSQTVPGLPGPTRTHVLLTRA